MDCRGGSRACQVCEESRGRGRGCGRGWKTLDGLWVDVAGEERGDGRWASGMRRRVCCRRAHHCDGLVWPPSSVAGENEHSRQPLRCVRKGLAAQAVRHTKRLNPRICSHRKQPRLPSQIIERPNRSTLLDLYFHASPSCTIQSMMIWNRNDRHQAANHLRQSLHNLNCPSSYALG